MSLHYRSDGGLDMRYSSSRSAVESGGYNSRGFSTSSSSTSSNSISTIHTKSNGTADMRYTSSKEAVKSGKITKDTVISPPEPFVSPPKPIVSAPKNSDEISQIIAKADGTADMRFKSSKIAVKSGLITKETKIVEKDTCPNIIITTKNVVSKTCKAFRSGYIKLLENGNVDPNCDAAKNGDIILKKDGTISKRTPNYNEIKRVSMNEITTDQIRDPNMQKKKRDEYHKNGGKKDLEASHIIGLGLSIDLLGDKPGLPLSTEKLKEELKELNSKLEMRTNHKNRDIDKKNDQKAKDILNGKEVKITRSFVSHIEKMYEAFIEIHNEGKMTNSIQYVFEKICEIKSILETK